MVNMIEATKYLGYFADVPALIIGYTKAENKLAFVAEALNKYVDIPNITEENETALVEATVALIEALIVCTEDYKNGAED